MGRRLHRALLVAALALTGVAALPSAASAGSAAHGSQATAVARLLAQRAHGKMPASPAVTAAFARAVARITRQASLGPADGGVQCSSPWHIQSAANGLLVAVEFGPEPPLTAGMLRARTDPAAAGPWEQFTLCTDSSGIFAYFFSDVDNGPVANFAPTDGAEAFMLRSLSNLGIGLYTLGMAGGNMTIQSQQNGELVAAELGYCCHEAGLLRARTDPSAAGPWEQFQIF